jgi:hypothetical protein
MALNLIQFQMYEGMTDIENETKYHCLLLPSYRKFKVFKMELKQISDIILLKM